MEKEVYKFLKKQYKKGKNSFARAMDIFGSRAGVFLGSYFALFMLTRKLFVAVVLAVIAVLCLSLVMARADEKGFDKFCEKYVSGVKKDMLIWKFMLMGKAEKCAFVKNIFCEKGNCKEIKNAVICEDKIYYVFLKHTGEKITPGDVLKVLDIMKEEKINKAVCVCVCGVLEESIFFAQNCGAEIEFFGEEKIVEFGEKKGYLPSDEEAFEFIKMKARAEKKNFEKLRKEYASPEKFKAYMTAGICLGLCGIFMNFNGFLIAIGAVNIFLAYKCAKAGE